ncbi:hypothetical protein [Burkholderia cepacia]|uniref:hypothetical protein n=1 Tax=Burkholderia cepacia TaxID=292 RepID=UPI002ABE46A4|nr:hypothetical protein [Burkholderia cepacia]
MINNSISDYLFFRTGTDQPFWKVTDDSKAISFGKKINEAAFACEICAGVLADIRNWGDEGGRVEVVIPFESSEAMVVLVGRKINRKMWVGIASASSDFDAGDLFMESLGKTFANNLIVLPRRNGRRN